MSISNPSDRELLMAGYVLGDLDLEESLAFEKMLKADPTLQKEIAQLQMSVEQVYGEEEVLPPPALKASVLAQTSLRLQSSTTMQQRDSSQADVSSSPSGISKKLILLGTGLLATATLYLSMQNYRLQQAVQTLQNELAVAEQRDIDSAVKVYRLDATENAVNLGEASLVELAIGADNVATLEVEGLPTLPDDKVYVLWTVTPEGATATTDDKNAILTTVFDVDVEGDRTQELFLPGVFQELSNVAALAITIEDAAAPQKHESSPILKYSL